MKTYVWVIIETTNKEKFFLKCHEKQIVIYETKQNKKELLIKILASDYQKLQKIWFIKTKLKEITGLEAIKEYFKKNHLFFISLVSGICLLFFLSHIMVSVEVIHSKKEIRDLVSLSLEEKGIAKNTWKKSYQEIQQIKEEILREYPEKLEWLEIEVSGMKYKIRVEERKLVRDDEEKTTCHIVALKDGIVKKVIYSEGEALFKENDAVKEGDILISGIIKKDEETKNVVCATGEVYAEVWYQVSVGIPLEYTEKTPTGKVRWNIKLKNNHINDFVFKSRVNTYQEEKYPLFTLFGTEIFFVKQLEVTETKKTYSKEEALNLALTKVEEKILETLEEKESIINKKVLKNEVNNSTMNVEVFVAVIEQIGGQQEFEIELSDNNGN